MNKQKEQLRLSQENEVIVDKELIAELWRQFDAIIEAKGREPVLEDEVEKEKYPVIKSADFAIDHRENSETIFKGEFIGCDKMRNAIVINSGKI